MVPEIASFDVPIFLDGDFCTEVGIKNGAMWPDAASKLDAISACDEQNLSNWGSSPSVDVKLKGH